MEIKDNYIFKYCTYDIGELIVSSQLLKFSNPKSFNDPFDCDINLLEFDFSDRSDEVEEDMKNLKKYSSKMWGQDMSQEIDKIPQDEIENFYKGSQLNKINNSSICCFSKNYKNTTMWSHYADNHKGICLIFDLLKANPFVDLNLVTQGPVDYKNYTSINYLKSKINGIIKLFLTKSEFWQYEEEYRFIIDKDYGLFKFHHVFFKGVIFGLRVTDFEIERFKMICQRNNFNNTSFARYKKSKLDLILEDL